MAKKSRKGLLAAALAFASTPQGRQLLMRAKEYASRPENQAKARQLISQARAKKGSTAKGAGSPPYGTPPKP